jgi:hypothetical protein
MRNAHADNEISLQGFGSYYVMRISSTFLDERSIQMDGIHQLAPWNRVDKGLWSIVIA